MGRKFMLLVIFFLGIGSAIAVAAPSGDYQVDTVYRWGREVWGNAGDANLPISVDEAAWIVDDVFFDYFGVRGKTA